MGTGLAAFRYPEDYRCNFVAGTMTLRAPGSSVSIPISELSRSPFENVQSAVCRSRTDPGSDALEIASVGVHRRRRHWLRHSVGFAGVARSNEDPMNKRIEGTCTNGREHRWLLPCRRSRVRVPSSALKTPASREFCFPDWKHESQMNPKKYVDVRRLPLRSGSSNRLPTRSDSPTTGASTSRERRSAPDQTTSSPSWGDDAKATRSNPDDGGADEVRSLFMDQAVPR
jgi:hypothetical protein